MENISELATALLKTSPRFMRKQLRLLSKKIEPTETKSEAVPPQRPVDEASQRAEKEKEEKEKKEAKKLYLKATKALEKEQKIQKAFEPFKTFSSLREKENVLKASNTLKVLDEKRALYEELFGEAKSFEELLTPKDNAQILRASFRVQQHKTSLKVQSAARFLRARTIAKKTLLKLLREYPFSSKRLTLFEKELQKEIFFLCSLGIPLPIFNEEEEQRQREEKLS